MLVIRCREGETVSIGDDITVTVLAAGTGRVKLGFIAPAEIRVTRRWLDITREQNRAAAGALDAGVLHHLKHYLCDPHATSLTCAVPVPDVDEVNRKIPLHRAARVDKYSDGSIRESSPRQDADGT